MNLSEKISHFYPCTSAKIFLEKFQEGEEQKTWNKCERGDWMLWLLGKLAGPPNSESRKRLVKAALACARLAPAIENPKSEQTRQTCLKTTNDYLDGTASLEDVKAAANAAYAAAYAAYAAAYAAYAVYAVAYAANAAIYAAAAYSTERRRQEVLRLLADEVRKVYVEVPKI
jgi:hypothetical protein